MLKYILTATMAVQILAAQHQPRMRPEVGALTTWFDQIVPLVIIGEGWSQRIILTNVDASQAAIGTIQFFTQSGAAWTVSTTTGSGSIFAFSLQPSQTYILQTTVSQGPQTLGWAAIQENTNGLGDFLGQTIFRKQTAGLPDLMCSVLLGFQSYTKMTVFFDNTGGNYTGMGVLTSGVWLSYWTLTGQAARTGLRSGRSVSSIAGPHRSLRARARSCTMC